MPPDPLEALRPLLARLGTYLQNHPEVGRVVADVSRGLANWADTLFPTQPGEPARPVELPAPPPIVPSPTSPPVDLSQLDLANVFRPPPIQAQPLYRGPNEIVPVGLPLIARRCRAKADAGRLVAVAPTAIDRVLANELIARVGTLPECFLWMLDPGGAYSDRPKVWMDLAGAFDTAAAAAELLHLWDTLPETDARRTARDILYLAAEAQAILYTAVADAGRGRDRDQVDLYVSLKERTKRAGVFVDRFMTINDPVDASRWEDLARRIAEFAASLRGSEERVRQRKKHLDKLKHKTRRLREEPDSATEEWPLVVQLLDDLVRGGMQPSNSEVRDWLLPVYEQLPDDIELPVPAAQVFRELDRYQTMRPNGHEEEKPEPLSEEVAEVRRLLSGCSLVMIGGLVRQDRRAALIRAFDLEDCVWDSTDEHESTSIFEAPISRPDVAVVLLAIRWSSHSYGEVQDYCARYNKLLVRLPGGYHPNQVAHQILNQVGDRLHALKSPPVATGGL